MAEIGAVIGVGESRVSQLRSLAIVAAARQPARRRSAAEAEDAER